METADKKRRFDLQDHLDTGKRIATALVILSAFLQSVYASYIKTEDENIAKEAYGIQSKALENFSGNVDVKIAELSGRLSVLERLCIESTYTNKKSYKKQKAIEEEEAPKPEDKKSLYNSLKIRMPNAPWSQP